MKRRSRKITLTLAWGCAVIMATAAAFTRYTHGQSTKRLQVGRLDSVPNEAAVDRLKLLTLNIAHGRKTGMHQALTRKHRIQSNLDDVADFLKRERPDVVALQESDGPSIWSGNFDQVKYLADAADIPFYVRGDHVRGIRLKYGTSILSGWPLGEARSITFAPNPPTFSKGFVLAQVDVVTENGPLAVIVVSVHLDFARPKIRLRQARRIIEELSALPRPLVLMGDFNCSMTSDEGALQTLCEELDLKSYEPKADMPTFPKSRERLDWILISPDLEFVEYSTTGEDLSDHLAVMAVVKLGHKESD